MESPAAWPRRCLLRTKRAGNPAGSEQADKPSGPQPAQLLSRGGGRPGQGAARVRPGAGGPVLPRARSPVSVVTNFPLCWSRGTRVAVASRTLLTQQVAEATAVSVPVVRQ